MKKSYYAMNAIVAQFVKHFKAKDIAEEIVEHLPEFELSVEDAKSTGYTFRTSKNCDIDESDVKAAIIQTMIDMIDQDEDGFDVEVVEKYEIEYSTTLINNELIDHTMTIKKDYREIYVEIDII